MTRTITILLLGFILGIVALAVWLFVGWGIGFGL